MLPNWNGADVVYSNAYRVLKNLAINGHAQAPCCTRKGRITFPGCASEEMRELISALDSGKEEEIKYLLIQDRYLRYR